MYYINVNGPTIRRNAVTGSNDPPISVRRGKSGKATYCHKVKIADAELVYSPRKPLIKCGARLVIRTEKQPTIVR